mgnify:CR=1 FL=1
MNEAYVYDTVRTPRGRGKEGGASTRSDRSRS